MLYIHSQLQTLSLRTCKFGKDLTINTKNSFLLWYIRVDHWYQGPMRLFPGAGYQLKLLKVSTFLIMF